jgi:hypothetical protein
MGNFYQKNIGGFLTILLITIFNTSFGQTNVSGVISSNTTWTKLGSPYNISGNTQINTGVTLTIEPGVKVIFNGDFSFKAFGPIIAVGNSTDSIFFDTNNFTSKIGKGIYIRSTATAIFDVNYNYLSGTIFKYCSFKNLSRGIFNHESGVSIENCNFYNNDIAWEPRSNLQTLVSNSIFNNNNYGLFTYGEDQTTGDNVACIKDILITGNEFKENNYGISIGMNQRTVTNFKVKNNKFIKNTIIAVSIGGGGYGPYLGDNVEISYNKFIENNSGVTAQVYNLGYNGCSGGGWGTNSELLIKANSFFKDQNAVNLNGIAFANVLKNIFDSNQRGVYIGTSSDRRSDNTIQYNQFFKVEKPVVIYANGIYYQTDNNLIKKNTFQTFLLKQNNPLISINTRVNNNRVTDNNFSMYDGLIISNTDIGNVPFSGNYSLQSRSLSNDINDQNDNIDLGLVQITNPVSSLISDAPISVPLKVIKSISSGRVVLTWSSNLESDISGYKIYYGGYTGYSYTNSIDVGNVTSTTLPAGISIDEDIAVTAYDASKDGIDDQFDGNESWYSPANKAPNAPANLVAYASGHKVKLNWDISTSTGINNYNIYRSNDGVNFTKLTSTTNNYYINSGLSAYTRYYYKVSAFDSLDLSYENYGLESILTENVNAIPTNRFYVDSASGNDATGIGSSDSPYKKISVAVTAAISGDTIIVGKGTYNDNVILTKELTILAQSLQSNTIIKPLLPTSQIFNFTSGSANSKLKGFILTGGGNVRGSAIDCNFSSPVIENCIITKNAGEAPIHFYYTEAVINNCLIYRNTGNNVFFYDPNDKIPKINHSTIVYNSGLGTGTSNTSLIPVFTNCIIYGNSSGSTGGNINILNSIVQGGYLGNETNIDASPAFIDSANNDFHLKNYSPAIGLGTNSIALTKDFEGNTRTMPNTSNPDAGAYETVYDHPAPIIVDSSVNGVINLKIIQNPIGSVNKLYFYKSESSSPTLKFDSAILSNSFIDIANQKYNMPLFYRVTSIGGSYLESGFSNEVKTIAFTSPVLNSPIDNSVKNDLSLIFKWTTIPYATKYKFQISKDSNFLSGVTEISQSDTSYTKNALSDNTNYYWRVQTWDSVHYSIWSKKSRFQTFILPPNFNSLKMGNKVDTLNWSVINSSNLKYFKIYRDTISDPKILLDSISGNKFSYIDTSNLQLGIKYYYRIAAGNTENLESNLSDVLSGVPFNRPPLVVKLEDKVFNNVGEFNSIRTTYSAVGSKDIDGNITSFKWYVNDSLVNNSDSILIYYYKQGVNYVKLVVSDNQDAKDSSLAKVSLSSFSRQFKGGFLGGVTAISQDRILTADSTFDPINGASIYMLDRSGNTIFPLIVSSKIFTTPSVASDSSIFITSGSSLNGFNKAGAPLWPTIPLGGNSFVTPTIDSLLSRIYLGVSNKNFFGIDFRTGKVAWNIIGDDAINSSAVITGDRKLVFTSLSGTLYGFDIRTNASQSNAKWKYSIGDIVSKSPAVDASNNLYIGTNSGNLLKLSLNNDSSVTKIWSVKLSAAIQSSAIIDADGFVYVGNEKGDFYKINPTNGAIIWVFSSGAAIRSTPAISEFGSIYFANLSGSVFSLSSDKIIKWSYKDSSSISANLLYINNMIYIGTESGKLFSIYDNPTTNTVNTSLSIGGTPEYVEVDKIKSMSDIQTITNKTPIWGTFQGNYRRSGSRNFDCPDIPVVKIPSCLIPSDSIRVSTNDLNQKYWVVNDKSLDTKDTVIYVKPTDKVKIIAYNTNGCNVSSLNNYIIPNSDVVKPLITTNTGTDRFCQNDSITMSSLVNGIGYQWNFAGYPISNAKSKSLTTNLSGAYSVSVINSYGCKSTSDISLIMSTIKPDAPSISRDTSGSLISSAQNGNQWYKSGEIISGATSRTFKPTSPNLYSVSTSNYGCVSALSTAYYFLVTDIINLSSSEFIKLAPNPFINQLNFDFSVKGYQKLNIDIFELSSARLVAKIPSVYAGSPIILSNLSSGTYIIRVTSSDGKLSYQFKMVKL